MTVVPFVADRDFTLYCGDALEVLRGLPDASVDSCATSPPFYGLRDYGVEGQIGLESSPDEWAARLVDVFREVRRVLRPEGTLWIEIGSSYASGGSAPSRAPSRPSAPACDSDGTEPQGSPAPDSSCSDRDDARLDATLSRHDHTGHTGSPHEPAAQHDALTDRDSARQDFERVADAVALHDAQVSTMPASSLVLQGSDCSRPPRDEAYPSTSRSFGRDGQRSVRTEVCNSGSEQRASESRTQDTDASGTACIEYKPKDLILQPFLLAEALRRDGWYLRQVIIWAKPNGMPESATDRCTTNHSYILLLSKRARYFFDGDAIAEPAAWERWGDQTVPKHEGTETAAGWITPKSKRELMGEQNHRYAGLVGQRWNENGNGSKNARSVWTISTRGYPGAHFATWPEALAARIIKAGCPEGGTILDPFAGAGTTALVARKLGRRSIGIELSTEYCRMAAERLSQLSLLAEGAAS